MTLNSLEVTNVAKNNLFYFHFFVFRNFLISTLFIFRIICGRACYGATVCRGTVRYHCFQFMGSAMWEEI